MFREERGSRNHLFLGSSPSAPKSEAGLDKNAADEINDISMHSSTEIEPRKAIHNLLCQRYGKKIGAKY